MQTEKVSHTYTLTLPKDVHDALNQRAERNVERPSAVIRHILCAALRGDERAGERA